MPQRRHAVQATGPTDPKITTMKVVGILVAFLAAAVLAPATAASAEPPHVQVHYDDAFEVLLPPPGSPPEATLCGLVNVPLRIEAQGYFSLKQQGSSDYLYFADRLRKTLTFTNPTSGLTYTVTTIGQVRAQRIVDNEDGTLTVTIMKTGVEFVYGPAGELLFTNRGMVSDTFLVATNGTVDPSDDVFLRPVGEPQVAGPHETFNRDFCADFLTFTTP